ncbi:hypothetical protein MLS218_02630 [Helicobacter pylori]
MDAIYPYVLVVHLLCAIIFIGYLFFDEVIFPNVKKMFGEEFANKANTGITQRAVNHALMRFRACFNRGHDA